MNKKKQKPDWKRLAIESLLSAEKQAGCLLIQSHRVQIGNEFFCINITRDK